MLFLYHKIHIPYGNQVLSDFVTFNPAVSPWSTGKCSLDFHINATVAKHVDQYADPHVTAKTPSATQLVQCCLSSGVCRRLDGILGSVFGNLVSHLNPDVTITTPPTCFRVVDALVCNQAPEQGKLQMLLNEATHINDLSSPKHHWITRLAGLRLAPIKQQTRCHVCR